MLKRIGLKNFKLHADTAIDAAPITVFIGPNNSGKSSIFQALLLWRQAAVRDSANLCMGVTRQQVGEWQPYLLSEDQLIDVGEFDQVVRRGEREVSISVSGNCRPSKSIEYGPGPTDRSLEVRIRGNRLVYHQGELTYEVQSLNQRGQLSWQWVFGRATNPQVVQFNFGDAIGTLNLQIEITLALFGSSGVSFTAQISPERGIALQELAQQFSLSARNFLVSIHPVFPIRGFEEVGYPLPPGPAETLDRMALADRTTALLSVLAYNRDIERRLSAWLEELVGVRIEAKLLPGKRVTILSSPVRSRVADFLFSNEGTGASQLPFILVPIGLAPAGETILLTEPEVHLHPRAQVQLTKSFVELVKKEERQFFIETHSEHVLHGLLNAVATGTLRASDLAVYYFENKAGRSVCTRLEVDEKGGVKGGLPGFFDQSLGELAEYLEALKAK